MELEFAVNATTFASIGAKAIDGISAETDIGMSGFALTAYVGVFFAYWFLFEKHTEGPILTGLFSLSVS